MQEKELKTFPDGSKKANLDVEIAVDMLSLSSSYDTAILVSGDEDFAYAVNAVAFKGCRVEIAGFRHNTAPKLIDVADRYIELDLMLDKISKNFDQVQMEKLQSSPLFLGDYQEQNTLEWVNSNVIDELNSHSESDSNTANNSDSKASKQSKS